MTEWDRLPRVALYRGHLTDRLGASSNGGGTVHAYGRKVAYAAFGKNGGGPLRSASGFDGSLMHEAKARGLGVGLVQSGHLAEPGTATFLARVDRRADEAEIVRQLVEAGPDVLLGGGETLFLPEGVMGRHGQPGVRKDGLDLVARARELGYRVVFTAEELDALPDRAGRVLGLFAAGHTFNDQPEEKLAAAGLPLYATNAPTVAHMTSAALRFLSAGKPPFLLVVEEEGTDNFANHQNAAGTLEAITRADEAIGVVRSFVERHPRTLMVTAADSDASGFFLVDAVPWLETAAKEGKPAVLPPVTDLGAPFDGRHGAGGEPFLSAPDAAGKRHPFGVAWTTVRDGFGAVVARGAGYRSEELPVNLDNTGLFTLFRAVLWGEPAAVALPGPR
jgi:alkaline phosphatase